jgi:hypothetical protein
MSRKLLATELTHAKSTDHIRPEASEEAFQPFILPCLEQYCQDGVLALPIRSGRFRHARIGRRALDPRLDTDGENGNE